MRFKLKQKDYRVFRISTTWFLFGLSTITSIALAQVTHPQNYTTIQEETPSAELRPVSAKTIKSEIDKGSDIWIRFDESKIREILERSPVDEKVNIRVEAAVKKGDGEETPVPIDNWLVRTEGQQAGYMFSEHVSIHNKDGVTIDIVDAKIEMSALGLEQGDSVRVRITELETQHSVDKRLRIRNFGLVPRITDSFFFLKRLGVSDDDEMAGIDKVNFAPAPGVSYSVLVSTRRNKFVRLVRPTFGLNVSFMDWDDPSFDPSTGMFVAGTEANDIEVGVGLVGSVFGDVLQFTYGWNLNVKQKRPYFGIGFSFINVVERIGGLIAK